MERLAELRNGNISLNRNSQMKCSNYCTNCGRADCDYIRNALRTLVEYEITGMKPEEIKELIKDRDQWRNDAIEAKAALGEKMIADAWIPVSDGLPEEYGIYLVTLKNLTGYKLLDRNVISCSYAYGDWHFDGWEDNSVIAWKPLPDPYKEESE